MTARLVWSTGGEARVLAIAADRVELRSTVPAPTGSRLEGTAAADGDLPAVLVRVKVHTCRRQSDGAFLLSGRPIDLPRAVRDWLAARAG